MTEFDPLYKTFRFIGWTQAGSELHFHYSFDDELSFTEKLIWPSGTELPDSVAFRRAADAYHLLAGVSYYKAYLAPTIVLEKQELTDEQADFLNQTYLQGLGEFLYTNKLDPSLIAPFASSTTHTEAGESSGQRPLVLIGGGKDSLTTVELLAAAGKEFETFRSNSQPWIDQQLKSIGAPAHIIKRVIDPQLLAENEEGALNGHVPITSIISAAALLQAIVSGNSAVITSNEASANIGNTEYKGLEINHQYSKSLAFEAGFADYMAHNITTGVAYFSLLRPWTELKIAEYFAEYVMPKYSKQWSSSNHNFKRDNPTAMPEWDASSPKSLSVFGMLAAFVGRQELLEEMGFNGFAEGGIDLWNELLGISGIKPFECVADIDEMRMALHLAQQSGNWPELLDFEVPEVLIDDYQTMREHRIPASYIDVLPTSGA